MLKYFGGSYLVTILGVFASYFWGEHFHSGTGLTCVYIALILAVLEISLSFDNAVVNAMKLEKMSPKWQHRFITWGILIAVFGMRFLFPLAVVAIFARVNIADVLNMALFGVTAKQWRETNPDKDGNIRDYAGINELICLSNMENINALLIEEGMAQSERLKKLNQIAIHQMSVLNEDPANRQYLK